MRFYRLPLIALLFLLLLTDTVAEPAIQLEQEEWTWNAGEVATFHGTFSVGDTDLDGATLAVSLKVTPNQDDTGRCIFTSLNDKKIKIRNQSDQIQLSSLDKSEGIPFQGSWVLPEEGLFQQAVVSVSLISTTGEALATAEMKCDNEGWFEAGSGQPFHLPIDLNQMVLILAISCGIIWAAAIIRSLLAHKHRTTSFREGASENADL